MNHRKTGSTRRPTVLTVTGIALAVAAAIGAGSAYAFAGTTPAKTAQPGKTVYATTLVSDWPESSGWATDNFVRTVTLTREYAVPASDCGASASSCWYFTESLAEPLPHKTPRR